MRRRSPEMSGVFDWLREKMRKQPEQPAGPPPPTNINLYDVLRVAPDASGEDIKSAFRDLALMFHPDRNPGDPLAERKYTDIAIAYAILGDPLQRAAYDRLRAQAAAPKPPRGIIPRPIVGPEPTREERPKEAAKPGTPAPRQLNMWEIMFGKPEEREEAPTGSIFEVMTKESPPPPQIPSAQSPYAWAAPFQKKVPLTPQIETPSPQEIFQIVQQWPLDMEGLGVWNIVRQERHNPAFHKVKAMTVDVLAGAGPNPAEWDLAEMFGIPLRQVDEFVRHRGRQAFFSEILYPIFDVVTQSMNQLKPVDIPGQFFLDWDPSGRMIQLIYTENVGRRPWE